MKKLFVILICLIPMSSFADPSSANQPPGELLARRTIHKTITGNWERGRSRAIQTWNYACSDWREDVEDALPKDEEVIEIRCGSVRCKYDGKKAQCTALDAYVTYQKKEQTKKD